MSTIDSSTSADAGTTTETRTTTDARDPVVSDRENARIAAAGLGIWLALTLAAVALLLLFGPAISAIFV